MSVAPTAAVAAANDMFAVIEIFHVMIVSAAITLFIVSVLLSLLFLVMLFSILVMIIGVVATSRGLRAGTAAATAAGHGSLILVLQHSLSVRSKKQGQGGGGVIHSVWSCDSGLIHA
jgi:hypothetical protein